MRRSRRRYVKGCVRNVNDRWVLKYYDISGTQRSETLGPSRGPGKLTKGEAERLRDERMRPLNEDRLRDRKQTTFGGFVSRVFLPARLDPETAGVRETTVEAQEQRLNAYILPIIKEVTFADLEQDRLMEVLKAAKARNHGAEMLQKIRSDLTQICKKAFGTGYLDRQIWIGLDRVKSSKPKAEKRTLSLDDYCTIWEELEERDRLKFDLVMFQGMRPSEVFGLRCGDLIESGLRVERSFYRGRVDDTKTERSNRKAGLKDELRERLERYIEGLPAHGATDWVFPSATLLSPDSQSNALRRRIKPALEPIGFGWVDFRVIRRSYSTRNEEKGRDLKMAAYQQGHDPATHLRDYFVPSPEALAKGPAEDYAEFMECLRKRAK